MRYAMILLPLVLWGCTAPEPWVKPYERGYLADPIMQYPATTLGGRYREHVNEVREGSRGASSAGAGGGCGCN